MGLIDDVIAEQNGAAPAAAPKRRSLIDDVVDEVQAQPSISVESPTVQLPPKAQWTDAFVKRDPTAPSAVTAARQERQAASMNASGLFGRDGLLRQSIKNNVSSRSSGIPGAQERAAEGMEEYRDIRDARRLLRPPAMPDPSVNPQGYAEAMLARYGQEKQAENEMDSAAKTAMSKFASGARTFAESGSRMGGAFLNQAIEEAKDPSILSPWKPGVAGLKGAFDPSAPTLPEAARDAVLKYGSDKPALPTPVVDVLRKANDIGNRVGDILELGFPTSVASMQNPMPWQKFGVIKDALTRPMAEDAKPNERNILGVTAPDAAKIGGVAAILGDPMQFVLPPAVKAVGKGIKAAAPTARAVLNKMPALEAAVSKVDPFLRGTAGEAAAISRQAQEVLPGAGAVGPAPNYGSLDAWEKKLVSAYEQIGPRQAAMIQDLRLPQRVGNVRSVVEGLPRDRQSMVWKAAGDPSPAGQAALASLTPAEKSAVDDIRAVFDKLGPEAQATYGLAPLPQYVPLEATPGIFGDVATDHARKRTLMQEINDARIPAEVKKLQELQSMLPEVEKKQQAYMQALRFMAPAERAETKMLANRPTPAMDAVLAARGNAPLTRFMEKKDLAFAAVPADQSLTAGWRGGETTPEVAKFLKVAAKEGEAKKAQTVFDAALKPMEKAAEKEMNLSPRRFVQPAVTKALAGSPKQKYMQRVLAAEEAAKKVAVPPDLVTPYEVNDWIRANPQHPLVQGLVSQSKDPIRNATRFDPTSMNLYDEDMAAVMARAAEQQIKKVEKARFIKEAFPHVAVHIGDAPLPLGLVSTEATRGPSGRPGLPERVLGGKTAIPERAAEFLKKMSTPAAEKGTPGKVWDAANRMWAGGVTVGRGPAYKLNNFMTSAYSLNGEYGPLKAGSLKVEADAVRGGAKGTKGGLSYDEIRERMRQRGMFGDTSPAEGFRQTRQAAGLEKNGLMAQVAEKSKVAPRWREYKEWATADDQSFKMAAVLGELERGKSLDAAIDFANGLIPSSANAPPIASMAQKVMPFFPWSYDAAPKIGKQFISGKLNAPVHIQRAMEASADISNRVPTVAQDDRVKQSSASPINAKDDAGRPLYLSDPASPVSVLGNWANLMDGPEGLGKFLGQNMGPAAQAIPEMLIGKDAASGRDLTGYTKAQPGVAALIRALPDSLKPDSAVISGTDVKIPGQMANVASWLPFLNYVELASMGINPSESTPMEKTRAGLKVIARAPFPVSPQRGITNKIMDAKARAESAGKDFRKTKLPRK